MTTGQLDTFPQLAKDLHEQLMKKIEASRSKLLASQQKASHAVEEIDGLTAMYEKMADDTDAFTRSISNSPLEVGNR